MFTQSQSTPQIFISHSSKDNKFATQLVKDLREAIGNDEAIWFDSQGGLRGGDEWERKIIKQVNARNIFIVILSPDAMTSRWVNFEIDMAWNRKLASNTRILPIRYTSDTFIVRKDLEGIQAINFSPPRPYHEAFAELLARCLEPIEDRVSRRTFNAITASTIAVMTLPGVLSIWGFFHKELSNTDGPLTALLASPLLYQADWSQGLAGWDSPGWTSGDLVCKPNTARKGLLFCDWNNIGEPGYDSGSSMFAPFLPATPNYAVEVEIQVIDTLPQTTCTLGILVRWLLNSGGVQGGYVAGIGGLEILKTPFFEVTGLNSRTKAERNASGEGFIPGMLWHRYRVEAKNNSITLYIDNQKIFEETDKTFQEAGQVGLLCSACRINVRNFKVVGL